MSALARNTDPITSHEAAAGVRNLSFQKEAIIRALKVHGPMPDVRLIERTAFLSSDQSIRSRRAELVRAGLVRPHMVNGQQVYETINGFRHQVWEAV